MERALVLLPAHALAAAAAPAAVDAAAAVEDRGGAKLREVTVHDLDSLGGADAVVEEGGLVDAACNQTMRMFVSRRLACVWREMNSQAWRSRGPPKAEAGGGLAGRWRRSARRSTGA